MPHIYNERIEMLRSGRWQMMTEPINYEWPVAGEAWQRPLQKPGAAKIRMKR